MSSVMYRACPGLLLTISLAVVLTGCSGSKTSKSGKEAAKKTVRESFEKDKDGHRIEYSFYRGNVEKSHIEPLSKHKHLKKIVFLESNSIAPEAITAIKDLDSVESVEIYNCPIDDSLLTQFKDLSQLRQLNFVSTNITGKGLENLSGLAKLNHLVLQGVKLKVDQLQTLASLKNLESLVLGSSSADLCKVKSLGQLPNLKSLTLKTMTPSDDDFQKIPAIPQLESLNVEAEKLTDRGIAHVTNYPLLKHLTISNAKITNAGLKSIGQLKELEILKIDGCKEITADGIQELAALKNLQELYVAESGIRGDWLKHLNGNQALKKIELLTSQASSQKIAEFKKSVPGCEIEAIVPAP